MTIDKNQIRFVIMPESCLLHLKNTTQNRVFIVVLRRNSYTVSEWLKEVRN